MLTYAIVIAADGLYKRDVFSMLIEARAGMMRRMLILAYRIS